MKVWLIILVCALSCSAKYWSTYKYRPENLQKRVPNRIPLSRVISLPDAPDYVDTDSSPWQVGLMETKYKRDAGEEDNFISIPEARSVHRGQGHGQWRLQLKQVGHLL